MNNCTFRGFWQAVCVLPEGRASLTGCIIDLTTSHTYPPEEEADQQGGLPVVRSHFGFCLELYSTTNSCNGKVNKHVPFCQPSGCLLVWCMHAPGVWPACRSGALALTPTCTWPAVS
jgi:hypothetical protein